MIFSHVNLSIPQFKNQSETKLRIICIIRSYFSVILGFLGPITAFHK